MNSEGLNDKRKLNDCDIFIENCKHCRGIIKNRIIKKNLILYECIECGNSGQWKDKPLSLQLEHKNGIGNDNRLENLCFLCPNCHSQTDTYAGKSLKIPSKLCVCGKEIERRSTRCLDCEHQARHGRIRKEQRKFDPSTEELSNYILQNLSWSAIGRIYNVSSVAVKKRAKKLKII